MFRNKLLLIMMGFSLVVGGFWALKAQDPEVRTDSAAVPAQTPSPAPTQTPTESPSPMQTPTESPSPTRTPIQSTPTDLSGTYTGTFKCEAFGLTGDTTLTVTGNQYTLSDGRSGQIVANTTRNYTSVAFQVPRTDPSVSPKVISFRARKKGDRLTLTAIGPEKCTFTPTRGRPTTTGTEVTTPAATQTPSPSPSPTASPEASPSPTPSESPRPSPRPTPSGTPAPSPSPGEPTPTPSPSPSPSPRIG